MAAPIAIEQTKTLDEVSPTTSQRHQILLKGVSFASKQLKKCFKGAGRMIDSKGKGLWFEVTGSTQADLLKRAGPYMPGKVGVFENLLFKHSPWVSGGIFVDLNPGSRVRYIPVPSSHPGLAGFHFGAAELACPLA